MQPSESTSAGQPCESTSSKQPSKTTTSEQPCESACDTAENDSDSNMIMTPETLEPILEKTILPKYNKEPIRLKTCDTEEHTGENSLKVTDEKSIESQKELIEPICDTTGNSSNTSISKVSVITEISMEKNSEKTLV